MFSLSLTSLCTALLLVSSVSGVAIERRQTPAPADAAAAAETLRGPGGGGFPGVPGGPIGGSPPKCDISAAQTIPNLPAPLTQPTTRPSFIALGVGTQNYTCSDAGAYVAAGAVASLFDVGCLYKNKALFSRIPDLAMAAWTAAPRSITAESMMKALSSLSPPAVLGQHFFNTNPITGTGTAPVWDFRSQKAYRNNPNAFVVATKVSGAPAPNTARDVDWLQLADIQGGLADEIYRTDTRDGRPPASCTPGSAPIQDKYVALYWMYGGTVKV